MKQSSYAHQLVSKTARQNWKYILFNIVTNLLSATLEGSTIGVIYLAVAYLSSDNHTFELNFINDFIKTNSISAESFFVVLIAVAVILQIILSISNYFNQVSAALISARAQPYVTGKIFERIMSLSFSCVSRYKVGDIALFMNDSAGVVDRQITSFNSLALGISFSIVYLIIIIKISLMLAAVAAVLTFVIAFIQYKFIPRLQQIAKRVTLTRVESMKYMIENVQALRLVHTFGMQAHALHTAEKLLVKIQKVLQKRAYIIFLPNSILEILPVLALALLSSFAFLLQGSQSVFLPMLLTFLLALQRLAVRLKATATAVTQIVDNSARLQRLDSILIPDDKEFEKSGELPFTGLNSDIVLQNVSLSYGNDNNLALQDLCFTIPKNKVTALVGESGAGKSSIVDLLIGLYQPTEGEIIINNCAIQKYRLVDWRQRIGVVSQDTFIFNASIFENIRYGCSDHDFDEVINASKSAYAHQFIESLPNGYNTIVGERGYRLSGGQRQRLALARALIKQPDILILDEATSALDSESERLIQQTLHQFQKDRTIIVIAHRLSTIVEADQILVLEKGKIIEQGRHNQLISKEGLYAYYWKLQSSPALV